MRFASCWFVMLLAAAQIPPLTFGIEQVTIRREGVETKLSGRLEIEAEDGGILLLTPDGVLWPIPKEELVSRTSDEVAFAPLSKEASAKTLIKTLGLPAGFKVHQTKHYAICYNTSPAYAQWVGGLYERLFGAFYGYWEKRGIELKEPELPLVALVFDSQEAYAAYTRAELGDGAKSIIGFYSLLSNRINMYDLTGIEQAIGPGGRGTTARINAILSRPGAERTVATIVHEATHQLAFNSGLQTRLADIPFWVSEGLAIYFETPDLQSAKGWKGIGGINHVNLQNFRKYQTDRPADSLTTLLTDDLRFRDSKTAANAYAEAWALNYFLLRRKGDLYKAYLKELAALKPLVSETPEGRLAMFQKHFGEDLKGLDTEFLRFIRSVD